MVSEGHKLVIESSPKSRLGDKSGTLCHNYLFYIETYEIDLNQELHMQNMLLMRIFCFK